MAILIVYASKHGSTQGIAERIAEKLRQLGKEAEARPVDAVDDPGSYEAIVIGSAVYYGSWLKEATEWVRRNQAILAERPVWLFSSGPLGAEIKDAEQQPTGFRRRLPRLASHRGLGSKHRPGPGVGRREADPCPLPARALWTVGWGTCTWLGLAQRERSSDAGSRITHGDHWGWRWRSSGLSRERNFSVSNEFFV